MIRIQLKAHLNFSKLDHSNFSVPFTQKKLRRSESIVEKISGKWLEDTPPVLIESQQFGFPDATGIAYFEIRLSAGSAGAWACVKDLARRGKQVIFNLGQILCTSFHLSQWIAFNLGSILCREW